MSCGIIQKDGKFLLVQRPEKAQNGLKWEFAGGKIEATESPEECLIRELKEELDIDVAVLQALQPVSREEESFVIDLLPFECEIVSGEVTLLEHIDLRWVDVHDLPNIDICKGDLGIIEQLKALTKIVK